MCIVRPKTCRRLSWRVSKRQTLSTANFDQSICQHAIIWEVACSAYPLRKIRVELVDGHALIFQGTFRGSAFGRVATATISRRQPKCVAWTKGGGGACRPDVSDAVSCAKFDLCSIIFCSTMLTPAWLTLLPLAIRHSLSNPHMIFLH